MLNLKEPECITVQIPDQVPELDSDPDSTKNVVKKLKIRGQLSGK
jgi:hypothetical protein